MRIEHDMSNKNNTLYLSTFITCILQPLMDAGAKLSTFDDLHVYLGIIPAFEENVDMSIPWAENYRRPHFTQYEGICYVVVKDLWQGILPIGAVMHTVGHELGHYVHTKFIGDDVHKWAIWAASTGHLLDLKMRYDGGYPRIPSQEDFANDFSRALQHKNHPTKNYYINLLKQHS